MKVHIAFELRQLSLGKASQLIDNRYIYQSVFAQRKDKVGLDVTPFAIVAYDNEIVRHNLLVLDVSTIP